MKKFMIEMVQKRYFSGLIEAETEEAARGKAEELWDGDPDTWAEIFAEPTDFTSYDPMPDIVAVKVQE